MIFKTSSFKKKYRLQGLPRNTGKYNYINKYWLVTPVFVYII